MAPGAGSAAGIPARKALALPRAIPEGEQFHEHQNWISGKPWSLRQKST